MRFGPVAQSPGGIITASVFVLFAAGLLVMNMASCSFASARKSRPEAVLNSIGLELLPVKAGVFLYGGPAKTSRPSIWMTWGIKTTLTRDYFLGTYEVTQEQFEKVMGHNPSRFKGKTLPVDSVTWNEALEFCRKLSEMPEEKAAGRVYSLPSSAEWEYACRAGSTNIFPWGDEDETRLGEYAWCRDRYGQYAEQTHPVGQKKPNAWGFCDMLGNVWEWTSDASRTGKLYYGTYPYSSGELTDPKYPKDPSGKKQSIVVRGGAWNVDFRSCNCVLVYRQRPLARDNDTGFRVKCVPGKVTEAPK